MAAVRYAYKPKTHVMVLATLFFAACAAGLFYAGFSNDRGLILNGIFKMDEGDAQIFYYVLSGVSVLMVIGGLYGFVMSARAPRYVVLDETGIEIPGGAGQKPVRIPYASIKGLEPGGAYKQRWLYVVHTGGRRAIMASMLEGKNTLDEIETQLIQRTKG